MPWCAWKSFGGKLKSAPNCVVKRDGRLEVFARGSDGLVWHLWQHEPMGRWSQWSMMNGTGSARSIEIPRDHYGYAGPTRFHLEICKEDNSLIVDSPYFDADRERRFISA